MELFTPKFDENGHRSYNEQFIEDPDYVDLLNMLNDCVAVLKEVKVEESMIETYGNVLMNAENMLHSVSTHYEKHQRKADDLLSDSDNVF